MTSLASQLQRLQERPVGDKRLSESFLFTTSESRNFSREQIHLLGVHGLQTLVAIDNRFHPFVEQLFDPHSTRVERKQLSADANRMLNEALEQFLTLLSPHLFITAAHQVFEYLVRVHEVHVYNVAAVLRAFLPYHDHSLFSRALLLLDLRDTGLAFLTTNQENGSPLLREHLVQACAASRKVLQLVCLTLAASVRMRVHNSAANALFVGVAVRLASNPDAEAIWRVLLPFVMEFMSGEVSTVEAPDPCSEQVNGSGEKAWVSDVVRDSGSWKVPPSREAVCSALVVVVAWSNEVQLSAATLNAIVKPIVYLLTMADKGAASVGVPTTDLLAVLNVLFSTQRQVVTQVTFAPQVELMLSFPWKQWAPIIASSGSAMYETLVGVLLISCLQRLKSSHSLESVSLDVQHFVRCAVEHLPLGDNLVKETIGTLMACDVDETGAAARAHGGDRDEEAEAEEDDTVSTKGRRSGRSKRSETDRNTITQWIQALERRFSRVFDATLSQLLSDASTQPSAAKFLARHLSGARYELIEVSVASGTVDQLPLFSCLFHPLPEVRCLAAKHMRRMTTEELMCSSASPTGSGHSSDEDNSLLGLMEHVARYEQSPAVGEQFLRVAVSVAKELLSRLLSNGLSPEEEVSSLACLSSGTSALGTRNAELFHFRGLFRSMWTMTVSQSTVRAHKKLFHTLFLPLLDLINEQSGSSPPASKNNKSESPGSGDVVNFVRSLVMYYTTLQYVFVVDRRARMSKTETHAPAAADVHEIGGEEEQFDELIADVERLLMEIVPGIQRTPHLFSDGEHDDKCTQDNFGNHSSSPSGKDLVRKGQQQGDDTLHVFGSLPLLSSLCPEASVHLRQTLKQLLNVREVDGGREQCVRGNILECCLGCAAILSAADDAVASGVTRMLLIFFAGDAEAAVGNGKRSIDIGGGYLMNLQEVKRAARGGKQERTGRGASNGVLSPFLPKNEFTYAMGGVVRNSMELRLGSGHSGASDSFGGRMSAEVRCSVDSITCMGKLLGYLSTPLLPLSANVTQLPPAYLRLLELCCVADDGNTSHNQDSQLPVNWFDLVYNAVFYSPATSIPEDDNRCSSAALFLTLLLPLAAPTNRREDVLKMVQDAVVSASSSDVGKSRSKRRALSTDGLPSSAALVIEGGLKQGCASVTTLNMVIESMALEESRARLTSAASNFLCRLMTDEISDSACKEPAVPFFLMCRAVEHFYPLRGSKTSIAIETLLPLLNTVLGAGGGVGEGVVSCAAANFLDAVCTRATVSSESSLPSKSERKAAMELYLALMRYPFLRVAGGRARPVYRHALTAFASVLSRGVDLPCANPVIFVQEGTKGSTSKDCKKSARAGDDIEDLAREVASVVLDSVLVDSVCVGRLGTDVLTLLTGTVGGYHRLFLPLVTQKSKQEEPDISLVVEALEVLATPQTSSRAVVGNEGADAWEPPSCCVLHHPLCFSDIKVILQLCDHTMNHAHEGKQPTWKQGGNTALALRLLRSIVDSSSSIRFERNIGAENEEEESMEEDHSLFGMIKHLLERFPLTSLVSLLEGTETECFGNGTQSLYRAALSFVRCVVRLCVSSPQSLSEGRPDGAATISRLIVKQSIKLMAGLLSFAEETPARAQELEGDAASQSPGITPRHISTITELLTMTSPLYAPAVVRTPSKGYSCDEDAGVDGALHIPIVALLIRLETVNFQSGKVYCRSAMDVCRYLLASFDVRRQLTCLTGMMQLLIDPHTHLSPSPEQAEENHDDRESHDSANGRQCRHTLGGLFQKLVKPNQVINRQEEIMYLISEAVKSEEFLSGFLALQHEDASHPSASKKKIAGRVKGMADAGAGAGGCVEESAERVKKSDECMTLLVSSLELFDHYSKLNRSTENDVDASNVVNTLVNTHEDTVRYGEAKAFAMLMELLAGNTLACVLAGISEPTFILCMRNLLTHPHLALRVKGLEVLLDRLHNALPTIEHTLSSEEVEEQRRRLRDPKQKLTLMEIIRVKARPVVTKESFALFSHLSALMQASTEGYTTQGEEDSSLKVLILSVGCMEELVRIVASGGSQTAEVTLLNVHRSSRVTEEKLSRLFGSRAYVREVDQWVDNMTSTLSSIIESFQQCAEDDQATRNNLLLTAASLLTALGTTCQVMGNAFTIPHSNIILKAVVNMAVFAATGLPPAVSRSDAGSILRQSSLNCLVRAFPSCWLMCHPYLPRIINAATHVHNVDDTETNYLSVEVMTMLEAVLEPQVFIEACTECVRGISELEVTAGDGEKRSRKTLRIRVDTHSLALLFSSVERRVASLSRQELRHLSGFVEGTTAQDNFWLSSMHTLANAPTLPSPDAIQPVLQAYTVFFLKFKAKKCSHFISAMAEWIFGEAVDGFEKLKERQEKQHSGGGDTEDLRNRDDSASVPRVMVHRWLLFYALCNHLLEQIGPVMDFAFPLLLPYVVNTLNSYCSSTTHVARHAADLIARSLEGALDIVRRIAKAQTPPPDHDHSIPVDNCLAAPEVFNAVMPAVVRQLTNLVYLADNTHDYAFRVEQHVIPAIRALFLSLASCKQQSTTQHELLRSLRHPSRHVRRMTLMCLDGVYEDGGGELAARLMAEMLPSVAELTEDRDDAVVEQARKLCINLSSITGQDVLYAMSSRQDV